MMCMMNAMPREPAWNNPPCPHLPVVDVPLGPAVTRRHGPTRGAAYYVDALRYAQSLWMEGKPAQALLQLNKAWLADLAGGSGPVVDAPGAVPPSPYRALAWLLQAARGGRRGFLGNPVRHFQHLASRMSGPRAETRTWRAWTCFHLAGQLLDDGGFPRDGEQIAREGLWIPSRQRALHALARLGWPGEARAAEEVFAELHSSGAASAAAAASGPGGSAALAASR